MLVGVGRKKVHVGQAVRQRLLYQSGYAAQARHHGRAGLVAQEHPECGRMVLDSECGGGDALPELGVRRHLFPIVIIHTRIGHKAGQPRCFYSIQVFRAAKAGDVQSRLFHTSKLLRVCRRGPPRHNHEIARRDRLHLSGCLAAGCRKQSKHHEKQRRNPSNTVHVPPN